jgi:hypothetical protein
MIMHTLVLVEEPGSENPERTDNVGSVKFPRFLVNLARFEATVGVLFFVSARPADVVVVRGSALAAGRRPEPTDSGPRFIDDVVSMT